MWWLGRWQQAASGPPGTPPRQRWQHQKETVPPPRPDPGLAACSGTSASLAAAGAPWPACCAPAWRSCAWWVGQEPRCTSSPRRTKSFALLGKWTVDTYALEVRARWIGPSEQKAPKIKTKNWPFLQKWPFSDHKKWHFQWPNQNSKNTFIVQTFPKYGPYDFYFVNLSLLGAILAIFQFCWFSGLFWPFSPCKIG